VDVFLADDSPTFEVMIERLMAEADVSLTLPAAARPIARLIELGDAFQVAITEGHATLVATSGRPPVEEIRELMAGPQFAAYVKPPLDALAPEVAGV